MQLSFLGTLNELSAFEAKGKKAMDLSSFTPIETPPRDGTKVLIVCEKHPEFGAHLMGWSQARRRWEGWAFALMRKVPTWWDESRPQPSHWKPAD